MSTAFLLATLQIILIDIVLSGDNAVLIALACHKLPPQQRRLGVFWGVFGAVSMRLVLIFFAIQLLSVPYLNAVGALLLLWIALKLMLQEDEDEGSGIVASVTLAGAVKTIMIADFAMSLDNVIAIAGAAKGSMLLTAIGLIVSIPLVVWGSTLLMRLIDRFPAVIYAGAALLGWVAGEMAVHDAGFGALLQANLPYAAWILPTAGALLVLLLGSWLRGRRLRQQRARQPLDDIAERGPSHQGETP